MARLGVTHVYVAEMQIKKEKKTPPSPSGEIPVRWKTWRVKIRFLDSIHYSSNQENSHVSESAPQKVLLGTMRTLFYAALLRCFDG